MCFGGECSEAPDVITGYVKEKTDLDAIVYEPVNANNQICISTGCVRYNLFYRSEVTGQIITIRSEHQ